MDDLAVEQIGDGGEPDMRMRAHIEPGAGAEFSRAHLIEEDEWPDHAGARRGQGAPHLEAVPRSTVRGTMTLASASQLYLSPATGSLPGKKLIAHLV